MAPGLHQVRRVAIIGAGPSGLAAAKYVGVATGPIFAARHLAVDTNAMLCNKIDICLQRSALNASMFLNNVTGLAASGIIPPLPTKVTGR